MKDPKDIRDKQVCLYFSSNEKEALDKLCDYFILSRTDFVRIAMYIAVNCPEVYLKMNLLAREEGILTGALHRRKR